MEKPKITFHRCIHCQERFTENDWNTATIKVFGTDITLIEEPLRYLNESYELVYGDPTCRWFYICPGCGTHHGVRRRNH